MSKRRAAGPAAKKRPRSGGAGRRRLRRALQVLLVLGLVGLLLGGLLFYVAYSRTTIPSPNAEYLTETTKVYYSDGETELGSFATQQRESIPLSKMPECIKDGVVAAENRTFWTDRGIDPRGILRAFVNNVRGKPTQGASTITQQYVKILYLTQDQTLTRKAKEALLSLKIQSSLSKEEILEGYLNTIYFGRGAYGVQAASEAFFGIPAKRLNLRQCAVLSSVINNPSRFDPANGRENREELEGRVAYVLDGMLEMEAISPEQHDRAARRLPRFPKQDQDSRYGGQRGHMLQLVRSELLRLPGIDEAMIDGGGLRVTTTLRERAMRAVAEGVVGVRPLDGPRLHAAAASVEVGTGALLGFFGGHDYLDSQINWAVSGGMAGSTMKAFTNAAAIKDGFSLKDTFQGNSPIELPDGSSFTNQGDSDYGSSVSMLRATQDSINTAYIDMVDSMDGGPQKVIEMARAMGVPGEEGGRFGIPRRSGSLVPNVGVTLGTAVISPINMANAYGTIANGGETARVHVIDEVVDRSGRTLYQFKAPTERAMSRDIAADVSYSLQQVVEAGSGTVAQGIGRPAAGKTGTATNDDDEVSSSWFVGYTPQISTAVMYTRGDGNDRLDDWLPASPDGRAGYFGGNYPAKTWTEIMSVLMEGREIVEFPEPAYVDGEAPDEGHEPYTPPATTSAAPEPEPEPTRTSTPPRTTAPAEPPSETTTPEEPPSQTKPPGPPEPTDEPTITDGPSTPPGPGGGGGGGGGGEGDRAGPDRTARREDG